MNKLVVWTWSAEDLRTPSLGARIYNMYILCVLAQSTISNLADPWIHGYHELEWRAFGRAAGLSQGVATGNVHNVARPQDGFDRVLHLVVALVNASKSELPVVNGKEAITLISEDFGGSIHSDGESDPCPKRGGFWPTLGYTYQIINYLASVVSASSCPSLSEPWVILGPH